MALLGSVGILRHHLFEERGDVVKTSILRVTHILPVIVTCLERMILN
jgi:hypothetical protein